MIKGVDSELALDLLRGLKLAAVLSLGADIGNPSKSTDWKFDVEEFSLDDDRERSSSVNGTMLYDNRGGEDRRFCLRVKSLVVLVVFLGTQGDSNSGTLCRLE